MNANFIVVGGPISVGKSTLTKSLGMPQIDELDDNDKIQMLMLENTYKKGRVAPEVIEHYFLEIRRKKYKEYANTLQTHVFDRSIFESLWFAKGNMTRKSRNHFEKLWEAEIKELIEEVGKPKLYILLTMEWKTFMERIFSRGREVEVKNFVDNEDFFRRHIMEYENHMIEIFEKFDINYIKIKTDKLSHEEVNKIAMKKIKEMSNV